MNRFTLRIFTALLVLAIVLFSQPVDAYSVFTHQEIVDLAWESTIRPLLLARFPVPPANNFAKRTPLPMVVVAFRTWATIHLPSSFSAT